MSACQPADQTSSTRTGQSIQRSSTIHLLQQTIQEPPSTSNKLISKKTIKKTRENPPKRECGVWFLSFFLASLGKPKQKPNKNQNKNKTKTKKKHKTTENLHDFLQGSFTTSQWLLTRRLLRFARRALDLPAAAGTGGAVGAQGSVGFVGWAMKTIVGRWCLDSFCGKWGCVFLMFFFEGVVHHLSGSKSRRWKDC